MKWLYLVVHVHFLWVLEAIATVDGSIQLKHTRGCVEDHVRVGAVTGTIYPDHVVAAIGEEDHALTACHGSYRNQLHVVTIHQHRAQGTGFGVVQVRDAGELAAIVAHVVAHQQRAAKNLAAFGRDFFRN